LDNPYFAQISGTESLRVRSWLELGREKDIERGRERERERERENMRRNERK